MPAAAVIPAPIAYLNVVAVKKLVVEPLGRAGTLRGAIVRVHPPGDLFVVNSAACTTRHFTLKKLECFRQAFACIHQHGIIEKDCFYFIGTLEVVMINRNSWGHSYLVVRGEILGFTKDELMRKHLPRMFSLIKNES